MGLNELVNRLTNSQIDKLGERLKDGPPSESDLTLLATYRNGFALPAKAVFDVVSELSGLQPAIRSEKTTLSVVAKLKREGIRLSQMQDISGCRVTVENLAAQDVLVDLLLGAFPNSKLYDRCIRPTHGYRAKHVVVRHLGKWIEIQVRTTSQHGWALLSENAADIFHQDLKYGVGDGNVLSDLNWISKQIAEDENAGIRYEASQMMKMVLSVTDFWKQQSLKSSKP